MTPEQQKALALARARRKRAEAEGAATAAPEPVAGVAEVSPADQIRAEYDALPWYAKAGQAADDIVRAVANGMTFNMADRLAGYASGEGVESEWQKNEAARARAGLAYDAGAIAGGVRTALSAGNQGLTLMGRFGTGTMTGLPGVALRSGLAGVEGAAYGGLDAAGAGKDIGHGAGIGALGGIGGNLIGETVQGIGSFFRGRDPRSYVSNAGQGDGLTPETAQAALDRLGPDARLADLGPNLQGQTAALATTPGANQQIVRSTLNQRNAGAAQRMTGALDDALGQRVNTLSLADDIVQMRSQQAGPLYEATRNVPVNMTDDVRSLLSRPSAQTAVTKARRALADRGESFSLDKPTVGMLDAIKKEFDDMIGPAVREGRKNEASRLMDMKKAIVQLADDAAPDYGRARQIFSDASTVNQALEDGANVFKNSISPDDLRRYMGQLDDASWDAFAAGARQQVADIMGTARNDATAAKTLFDRGYNQEKLALIVGEEEASELLGRIGAEKLFSSTSNKAMGGSDTIPKGLAQSLIAGGNADVGVVRNLLNMNFGDALAGAGNFVLGPMAQNRNERINAEIAQILMGRDASALGPVLQDSELASDVARALIGAGVGANNEERRPLELTVTPRR